MLSVKELFKCFYLAIDDTVNHDGIEHAGYLAFLALLSFFPFLVFFFSIAGYLGQSELGIRLINIILENNIIPSNILPGLQPRIEEIRSGPPQGLLTISIIGAIWTASSMVDGIKNILNKAYRVSTPPSYIFRRLASVFEFIIMTAFLIIATLFLIIFPNIWEYINSYLNLENVTEIFEANSSILDLRYLLSSIILFILVTTIYKTLPNTKQKFFSLAPGAFIVVLLWFLTGSAFSSYITNFNQVNVIYGSLGGIIVILLFFYITSAIFIFGAEFNYRIEKAKGNIIEEKEPEETP